MAGFENDIVYAKNGDFTQADNQSPTEANGLATNGQIWIGTTSTNAGGTHINVGAITSPGGTITVGYSSPNITLAANGSLVGQTITGDSGGALSPTAGNWNILGQKAGTIPVVDTIGLVSTLNIEDRTWTTPFVVDPSSTVGLRGTYTTIASALTDASSGQTIFIRAGTYTEDLTLKSGVNLSAFSCDAFTPNVTIVGNCTATFAGTCTLSGIRLQTNSASALTISGSNATIVNLVNCYINASNNLAITYSSSSPSSAINLDYCLGNIVTSTGFYTQSSAGTMTFNHCIMTNTAASQIANTNSAGLVIINFSNLKFTVRTSTTGGLQINNSVIDCNTANLTPVACTGSGTTFAQNSTFLGNTTAALTVNTPAVFSANNVVLETSNANCANGTGTLLFSNITGYDNTTSTNTSTVTVTTQQPYRIFPGAVNVKTPAAGSNYNALVSDFAIFCNFNAARSVILPTTPFPGQSYRIKDISNNAATNNITVDGNGINIDAAATYAINTNYGSIDVIYNGTTWSVL